MQQVLICQILIKKADLANLKSVVDKLDINNLAELDADVWNLFLLVKKK